MSTNRNGKTSGGSGAKTIQKKEVAKAYEKYAEKFTPKPTYLKNCIIAFIVGGLICMAALYVKNRLTAGGIGEEDAGTFVTMMLVCTAQLLTGFGWFDTIGKVCGAGVIVPITGFANSMVAPAIEYKKEELYSELVQSCLALPDLCSRAAYRRRRLLVLSTGLWINFN